jgi:hypothetical protein
MERAQGKKRELTPKAFTQLLAKLDPDPEMAGEKYEKLRRLLIKFFECRGSFISDELADETLNRLARKIDEGEEIEKNVFAFSLGIARFVFLEALKRPDNICAASRKRIGSLSSNTTRTRGAPGSMTAKCWPPG